jgi:hypothetical protein
LRTLVSRRRRSRVMCAPSAPCPPWIQMLALMREAFERTWSLTNRGAGRQRRRIESAAVSREILLSLPTHGNATRGGQAHLQLVCRGRMRQRGHAQHVELVAGQQRLPVHRTFRALRAAHTATHTQDNARVLSEGSSLEVLGKGYITKGALDTKGSSKFGIS